jgi:hypothetical protein
VQDSAAQALSLAEPQAYPELPMGSATQHAMERTLCMCWRERGNCVLMPSVPSVPSVRTTGTMLVITPYSVASLLKVSHNLNLILLTPLCMQRHEERFGVNQMYIGYG